MTRYTLIVGTRNWSSWSLRPFVALKTTGAPFEVMDIRLRQTDHPTTRPALFIEAASLRGSLEESEPRSCTTPPCQRKAVWLFEAVLM